MEGQQPDQHQQIQINPGPIMVDSKAFGAKYTSKRELYRFLTHDCGAYLATYQSMTVWHMRDLISGERAMVSEKTVKQINVPYFEGLKIESFLEFASSYPQVMKALPILERERLLLPRSYIANVIYTIVGEDFKKWVDNLVKRRHDERRQEQSQIKMDPEIAAIFNLSTATSGK